MKRLILILCLILLAILTAIAIGPMLIDGKGYITVVSGDTAYQTTILSAVYLLTALFLVLLAVLFILRGGLRFSLGGWHKLTRASQRRALKNFNKGITAYVIDDYAQAEQLLAKSAQLPQFEQTAYLLAASAADKQNSGSNHYLERVGTDKHFIKNAGLEGVLVKVKIFIGQGEYSKARELIDNHHKYIGHDARLLALEIDLCLIEQRFEAAIEHLKAARKQKTISKEKLAAWEREAFAGIFNDTISQADQNALFAYWKKLPRKIQQSEPVLLAYCRVLAENKLNDALTDILLPVLKKDPRQQQLRAFQVLPVHQGDALIAQVQKQLGKHQQEAKWLSYLGHLAFNSEQWQMSERAFNSLLALETPGYDASDLEALASVLSQQGKFEQANKILTRRIKMQASQAKA
ncbi:heme biosynthesis HemY N-terminal domain-containing protein [Thalassomonas actiniarum]|uniref:Heme biosynthesis protein HemY n=1 Tax=Thalassomonas actiniarum TaxID=485447 RepID=A0AAE9YRD6_9GAMM|nr:heme biosynthesis HemY N-terminal domain-containing protein [Thalassomonas actiniarum]WDD99013.1 heme biosynthesis protein HemY [Thalassomonas actiniarum]